MAELKATDTIPLSCISPTIQKDIGLHVDEVASELKPFQAHRRKKAAQHKPWEHAPVVLPSETGEVKQTTGCANMLLMLSFAIAVTNGSLGLLTSRITSLTWQEEWCVYFEWTWGRTACRWQDLAKRFKISTR